MDKRNPIHILTHLHLSLDTHALKLVPRQVAACASVWRDDMGWSFWNRDSLDLLITPSRLPNPSILYLSFNLIKSRAIYSYSSSYIHAYTYIHIHIHIRGCLLYERTFTKSKLQPHCLPRLKIDSAFLLFPQFPSSLTNSIIVITLFH